MTSKPGAMKIVGEFREVVVPERLVYAWRPGAACPTGASRWSRSSSATSATGAAPRHFAGEVAHPSGRRVMKVHAANEILIECPAAEVFAFVADAENDARWRPGVVDISRVAGDGA